jgi:hypothetical protein
MDRYLNSANILDLYYKAILLMIFYEQTILLNNKKKIKQKYLHKYKNESNKKHEYKLDVNHHFTKTLTLLIKKTNKTYHSILHLKKTI